LYCLFFFDMRFWLPLWYSQTFLSASFNIHTFKWWVMYTMIPAQPEKTYLWERFEDIKGVIRNRKSKKDRQVDHISIPRGFYWYAIHVWNKKKWNIFKAIRVIQ
jgi:hypothetical protein